MEGPSIVIAVLYLEKTISAAKKLADFSPEELPGLRIKGQAGIDWCAEATEFFLPDLPKKTEDSKDDENERT